MPKRVVLRQSSTTVATPVRHRVPRSVPGSRAGRPAACHAQPRGDRGVPRLREGAEATRGGRASVQTGGVPDFARLCFCSKGCFRGDAVTPGSALRQRRASPRLHQAGARRGRVNHRVLRVPRRGVGDGGEALRDGFPAQPKRKTRRWRFRKTQEREFFAPARSRFVRSVRTTRHTRKCIRVRVRERCGNRSGSNTSACAR